MSNQSKFNTNSIFDSKAEDITFKCLNRLINTDAFDIFVHHTLLATFKRVGLVSDFKELYRNYCHTINKPEMTDKMVELCHFDFVICDKEYHIPYAIIEVNGKRHLTDPSQVHIDLFKKFVATHMFERPFIEIDLSYACIDDQMEQIITEALNNQFLHQGLKYPYSRPAFCTQCSRKMYYRGNGNFFYCTFCKNQNGNSLTRSANKIPWIIADMF